MSLQGVAGSGRRPAAAATIQEPTASAQVLVAPYRFTGRGLIVRPPLHVLGQTADRVQAAGQDQPASPAARATLYVPINMAGSS
jgi:hypothetical protein